MQDASSGTPGKRRRRKEARPAEIISAAMLLWAERGFAATRLEDVAIGAGIAKGTIYRYFPSKEALFEAAVQERIVATMDRAHSMAQDFDGPTETVLSRFLQAIREELVEGGSSTFLRILLSEGHRFPDLVGRYRTLAVTRGLATVRAILQRGVARGDLQPGAATCDPRLVVAPAMMLAVWDMVFRSDDLPAMTEALDQHVAILMRGLGSGAAARHPPPA